MNVIVCRHVHALGVSFSWNAMLFVNKTSKDLSSCSHDKLWSNILHEINKKIQNFKWRFLQRVLISISKFFVCVIYLCDVLPFCLWHTIPEITKLKNVLLLAM